MVERLSFLCSPGEVCCTYPLQSIQNLGALLHSSNSNILLLLSSIVLASILSTVHDQVDIDKTARRGHWLPYIICLLPEEAIWPSELWNTRQSIDSDSVGWRLGTCSTILSGFWTCRPILSIGTWGERKWGTKLRPSRSAYANYRTKLKTSSWEFRRTPASTFQPSKCSSTCGRATQVWNRTAVVYQKGPLCQQCCPLNSWGSIGRWGPCGSTCRFLARIN